MTFPAFNTPRWSRRLLLLALGLALVGLFLDQVPELGDRYRVVKDVQNMYRMARYRDPALFANDPMPGFGAVDVEILGRPIVFYPRNLGYGLLLYLPALVVDYLWLIKGLGFGLMAVTVVYLFKLGQAVGDNLAALSLSLLFAFFILAADQSIALATGLQRAFAVPLLFIFVYYMARRQYVGAGLALVAAPLFYLPDLPLIALAYGLSLVGVGRGRNRRKWAAFGLSAALAALVVGLALGVEYGWLPFSGVNRSLPEPVHHLGRGDVFYHSQEYAPLFFAFPLLGRAGILDSGADTINMIVLLVLGGLVYKTVGAASLRRVPGVVWYLLAAAVIMYVASLVAIFGLSSTALYYPSRYTRSTLFVVMLCFVGLNWPQFVRRVPAWLGRNRRLVIFFVLSFGLFMAGAYLLFPARLLLIPLLVLLGLVVAGVLAPLGGSALFWLAGRGREAGLALPLLVGLLTLVTGGVYIRTLGLKYINPTEGERAVYEFVATLPPDVLVAGEPQVMVGIPLFARRTVLLSALQPSRSAPILDWFDAQYAESGRAVLDFCRRYEVDYLVLDSRVYSPEYLAEGKFFYRPWNDRIIDLVAGRSDFVLPRLEPVFAGGPWRVVRCDADSLLSAQEGP